ncbi:hypothetical protein BGZ46_008345, partial [Entomortierella lignicola]
PKRRFEDDEPDTSRKSPKYESQIKKTKLNIFEAVEAAGLTTKAKKNGVLDLSPLTSKDLVAVLENTGLEVLGNDEFRAVALAASALRRGSVFPEELISGTNGTRFPVVEIRDLYIRQAFKDLYSEIETNYGIVGKDGEDIELKRHLVITGTAGIGKSSFLIYFILRVLATSTEENPPLIVFQEKESERCFAFGGLTTLRVGILEDFLPFLDLTKTWYLIDSSPDPRLPKARTIISASPKTLYSDSSKYQDIDKRVPWTYFMAPWTFEELNQCRLKVTAFRKITKKFLTELYDLIGGVPSAFRLEWASIKIRDEVERIVDDSTWQQILERLANGKIGEAKGPMFELYVRHIFRQGGYNFQARELQHKTPQSKRPKNSQDYSSISVNIPINPRVKSFSKIEEVAQGTLCLPISKTFPCVDMLLAHKILLQVTVNNDHGIAAKPFKDLIVDLKTHNWIKSAEEIQFVFVVPKASFTTYKRQNFLTTHRTVDTGATNEFSNVKQYVLGIDLQAAVRGQSPNYSGKRTTNAHQVTDEEEETTKSGKRKTIEPALITKDNILEGTKRSRTK